MGGYVHQEGGQRFRAEARPRLPVGGEFGSPPLTWHQWSRGSKALVRAGSLVSISGAVLRGDVSSPEPESL